MNVPLSFLCTSHYFLLSFDSGETLCRWDFWNGFLAIWYDHQTSNGMSFEMRTDVCLLFISIERTVCHAFVCVQWTYVFVGSIALIRFGINAHSICLRYDRLITFSEPPRSIWLITSTYQFRLDLISASHFPVKLYKKLAVSSSRTTVSRINIARKLLVSIHRNSGTIDTKSSTRQWQWMIELMMHVIDRRSALFINVWANGICVCVDTMSDGSSFVCISLSNGEADFISHYETLRCLNSKCSIYLLAKFEYLTIATIA